MSKSPSDEVVRLTTAQNPFEAHIWERALRDAGIGCKVVGDYLEVGLGDIQGLRPEIWVHQSDLARAEEVLRSGQEQSRRDSAGNDEPAEES